MIVHSRGLALHADVRGEGPLTLLLHGWLDCSASFSLLQPLLPHRTAALDFRGHGDSAWLQGGFYHFIDYIADIDAALDALSPREPARIVAHSMGGSSALLYFSLRPERVESLTMIDALPLLVEAKDTPQRAIGYLDDLRGFPRERKRVASVEEAAQRLMRNNPSLTEKAATILARGNTSQTVTGLAWKWDPLLRARSPLPVTREVAEAFTARVTRKVTLLRAGRGVCPEESEIRARYPFLEVTTLENAGHHAHLDEPVEVARLIAEGEKSRAARSSQK